MSWRTVVISERAKLDYQLGFMLVRGKKTAKIHIGEIRSLIIESTAVSMTAYLLNELIDHKVKVIFCDGKRNPASELVPYYGSHDCSEKIQKQILWKKVIKDAVWREIVIEKIRKQAELLEKNRCEEYLLLRKYIKEVEPGDLTNREAHAAKVYFNALWGMGFSRAEDCPVNAALNYGYSIILSCFTREIANCGYLTQLGIFHCNMFNPFNLASDLMEPYRPIIDEQVLMLSPVKFEKEEKHSMLSILDKKVIMSKRREYLNNSIKLYVKSVFDALNDQDVSKLRFYKNEL